MNSYLLDGDVNYKILILNILKSLNTDIKRTIYEKLLTYEIIEETIQGWAQRKIIFMLGIQIDCLEYKLQHNISYNMNHNE